MPERHGQDRSLRPTTQQQQVIDQLAARVVRYGMVTPAVLFLESVKPLNRMGSTALYMFQPALAALVPFWQVETLAELLEDRRAIEYLIRAIEARDRQDRAHPRTAEDEPIAGSSPHLDGQTSGSPGEQRL